MVRQNSVFSLRYVVTIRDVKLIYCRGTACQNVSEGEEPFRVWCGLVDELRSLLDVLCLAITATVSASTRKALTLALELQIAVKIVKSPDRPNIHLSVKRVAPDFETIFDWLLKIIQTLGVACPRILVYCRTQEARASLYLHFNHTLGKRPGFLSRE